MMRGTSELQETVQSRVNCQSTTSQLPFTYLSTTYQLHVNYPVNCLYHTRIHAGCTTLTGLNCFFTN